jgi:uncharacterized Tic20 family protein
MGSSTGHSRQTPTRRRPQHAVAGPVTVPSQAGRYQQALEADTGRARPGRACPGLAGPGLGRAGTVSGGARLAAVLAYLLAATLSFLPPLLISLSCRHDAAFLRAHAVQALNAAFTTLLYALSASIVAAVIALDSSRLGIAVGLTAVSLCWLLTFGYLVAGATSAARGRFYQLPRYLCADLLKP